ncbi:SGNH/GDSL hydrolase family protein [Paenibacillus psychroresistens]|uniref:SGNH/GDSL hydrolase family protein n=1 Tax=Paenibacillus psychroresistens TaxID=1778678 RepID=A0A6B8REF8_9BACL|nr:GDSL-type esterase/lipase family protein [Paenibacillus psychroresistens]QGQ94307.1 SGNH/GDSL hydrolase family protein [Paenibacillus psychroresistens]
MFEYMALGDSITVGVGASSRCCAYPWLIKQSLVQKLASPVGLRVVARSGWTSAALMTSLFSQDPNLIRRSNVIVIWIGGDDLVKAGRAILRGRDSKLLTLMLTRYKQNLNTMICGIKRISNAKIILCTQYNPFPNSPIAISSIQSLNQITKAAATCHRTELALIHLAFAGHEAQLIQCYNGGRIEDVFNGTTPPIHPNNAGQRVAADVIYPRF